MPASEKTADYVGLIKDFLHNGGPNFALLALAILVGLPVFLCRLPQIITSLGKCVQDHRKTTSKIKLDREKMSRALESRPTRKKGSR